MSRKHVPSKTPAGPRRQPVAGAIPRSRWRWAAAAPAGSPTSRSSRRSTSWACGPRSSPAPRSAPSSQRPTPRASRPADPRARLRGPEEAPRPRARSLCRARAHDAAHLERVCGALGLPRARPPARHHPAAGHRPRLRSPRDPAEDRRLRLLRAGAGHLHLRPVAPGDRRQHGAARHLRAGPRRRPRADRRRPRQSAALRHPQRRSRPDGRRRRQRRAGAAPGGRRRRKPGRRCLPRTSSSSARSSARSCARAIPTSTSTPAPAASRSSTS